jgi:hypothetical protein
VIGAAICMTVHDPSHPPHWMTKRKSLRKVVAEFNHCREGAADLMHPRVLLLESACSAAYLVLASAGLWVIAAGPGGTNLSFPAAHSVFSCSLASSLIVPAPSELGAE